MDIEYIKSKLLSNGESVIYDLKDEFFGIVDYSKCINSIDKVKAYMNYKPQDKIEYIDCDVSLFSVSVYKEIHTFMEPIYKRPTKQIESYPNKIYKHKYQLIFDENKIKYYYRGDTMTSFCYTNNHFVEVIAKKIVESNDDTFNISSVLYEISTQINKLAKLYHTIGNMILVPSYFNSQRSGYGKYDFWDLVMQQVKEWYKLKDEVEKRKKPLEILLNPVGTNKEVEHSIKFCEKWLSYFETWNDFVKDNYLEVFIKRENEKLLTDNDGNFEPIVFWKNHSHENPEFPNDIETFLKYTKSLNEMIEQRNEIIIKQLK